MTALLYEIIYVWVAAAGLVSFFFPKMGIEEVTVPALVITLIIASVIPVLRKSGWTVRLIVAGILIALSVAGFFLYRNDVVREFMYGYRQYIYVPLISLGAVLIGEALAYIKPLKIPVTILLIAYMVIAGVKTLPVDKIMILCVSLMIIITVIEEMQKRWSKTGDTDARKHLVYVFPFVCVTVFFILICPAPEDPYDWQFVKRIAKAAYELVLDIERKITPDGVYDPTAVSIGFSGRGEINGNIAHRRDEVLVLHDLSSSIRNVRLAGKTFDTFDGRQWFSNDPSTEDDAIMDTMAFLATVSEYTEVPADLCKRTILTIEYKDLNSQYVFAPLKSLIGPEGADGNPVMFESGDMLWEEGNIPGSYYLNYYRLNSGNPIFTDFLKNADVPSRTSYEEQLADKSLTGEPGISYEDYLEYIERVRQYYAQPVELSEDLRSLMDEVYEGCEDDIDKAEKLCSLLKSYEYTDSPGPLPDTVTDAASMLDYFMLESKRGYCTHYATAFVLLARAEGIPARLVQGYYVSTNGTRDVTLYTSMAHAWPEIYIDGAGWITYEPTPGYGTGSYWRTEADNSEMVSNIGAGYEGYNGQEEPEPEEAVIEAEPEEPEKAHIPWFVIVVPPVSGILFVVLFILTGNLIVTYVFSRKDTEERYKILCRQILGLLAVLGQGTKPGETLSEYGERIGADGGEEIGDFIGNLTLYLYAGKEGAKEYEKQAYSYRNTLLKRVRKERPVKYLTYYLGFQKVKYGKTVDNA